MIEEREGENGGVQVIMYVHLSVWKEGFRSIASEQLESSSASLQSQQRLTHQRTSTSVLKFS